MDLDLYFMDLKSGHITRLTNNHTWTEQAIFSPDGKRVIYMSIKDHEGDWAAWSKPTSAAGLSPANDFLLITPLFFGLFLTPGMPPACDLYEIDLASGNQRRLTHDGDDGWIIPELAWDFAGTRLMWTELKVRDGLRGDSDPSRQPSDEVNLLQNPPPTPDRGLLDSGNELPYVTWRTRIARYVYGAVSAATMSGGTATAPGTAPLPETAAGTLPNTSLAASPDGRLFVPAFAALGAVIATVLSVVRRRRRHQR
jgi:hypothetical protein